MSHWRKSDKKIPVVENFGELSQVMNLWKKLGKKIPAVEAVNNLNQMMSIQKKSDHSGPGGGNRKNGFFDQGKAHLRLKRGFNC